MLNSKSQHSFEKRNNSLKELNDSATMLNSSQEGINRSSINSFSNEAFKDNMQNMFDLNSDLNTDLNEFNAFYNNTQNRYAQIERPQNPFHQNFESYNVQNRKHASSFSESLSAELVLAADKSLENEQ
jgi:hypothetical protein